jgi:hypothetical protein
MKSVATVVAVLLALAGACTGLRAIIAERRRPVSRAWFIDEQVAGLAFCALIVAVAVIWPLSAWAGGIITFACLGTGVYLYRRAAREKEGAA